MARIKSKVSLVNYIKMQLGAPLLRIEVTDDMINQIIDDSIQHFTEYAYGELEAVAFIELGGRGEYELPELITNIEKISKGGNNFMNFSAQFGNGFVPDMWSENFFTGSGGSLGGSIIPNMMSISATTSIIDKFMGDEFNFNFNPHSKILQLMENVNASCLLSYKYEYVANDESDPIFNHEWIKRFCTSKTKFLWGSVTGKFDTSLVGGARINYADMKAESTQEMEILEDELRNKWSDPAPIDIA